ncbi:MAG: hypothetical protein JST54_32695 [Deltaproteobacteria bacterium]|nr:hypothetical protein [Deltaproteobacteria bacterium]
MTVSLTQANSANARLGLSAMVGTSGLVSLAPGTGFTARGGDWIGSGARAHGSAEDQP